MQRPGIQKHHGGYPPSASSVMGMVHHPPAILHPAHAMGSGGPPSMPSMTSHHSGSLARSGHRHHHHGHPHEGPSAWQTSLSDIHQAGGGSISHRGPSANPALVIPRAKVKRSSVERGSHVGGGYTNAGYHSDDDVISQDEVSFHLSFSFVIFRFVANLDFPIHICILNVMILCIVDQTLSTTVYVFEG